MDEFEKLRFEVNNLKSEIELDQNHHGDGAVFDNLVAIYEQLAIISEKLGYDINWVRQEYQKTETKRSNQMELNRLENEIKIVLEVSEMENQQKSIVILSLFK